MFNCKDSKVEIEPINILFTKPPGPFSEFVEVETDDGKGLNAGTWFEREDGLWCLRITMLPRKRVRDV